MKYDWTHDAHYLHRCVYIVWNFRVNAQQKNCLPFVTQIFIFWKRLFLFLEYFLADFWLIPAIEPDVWFNHFDVNLYRNIFGRIFFIMNCINTIYIYVWQRNDVDVTYCVEFKCEIFNFSLSANGSHKLLYFMHSHFVHIVILLIMWIVSISLLLACLSKVAGTF